MKYLFLIIATITLSISTSNSAFGQDAKAQAILDKVSTKIKNQNAFYIEFSATVKNSSTGANSSESGKGWIKGDKYYASYGDITIISNGRKVWQVSKEEKAVYEADADGSEEDVLNPKKLMTIWESGFKNKYSKEEALNGEQVHVIDLFPKNASNTKYHTIIVYISKANNDLKKVIIKLKDGTILTYSLTKFQENATIEDSKFVFDPGKYPGYSVIKD